MSIFSQHKDEYYAKELEKILVAGIKESIQTISFLSKHVYPLYLSACKESNYNGNSNLEVQYSNFNQKHSSKSACTVLLELKDKQFNEPGKPNVRREDVNTD